MASSNPEVEEHQNGSVHGEHRNNSEQAEDVSLKLKRIELEFKLLNEEYKKIEWDRDRLKHRLAYIENSRVWRYTSPARKMLTLIKRLMFYKFQDSNPDENRICLLDIQEMRHYPVVAEQFGGSSLFQIRANMSPGSVKSGLGHKKLELLLCLNENIVSEYIVDLGNSDIVQDAFSETSKGLASTLRLLAKGLPAIILSARVDCDSQDEAINILSNNLQLLNHQVYDNDSTRVQLSKTLFEICKELLRESPAQYKLLHLLLAYLHVEKDWKATIIHLHLALSYPGSSLKARFRTSYFSEGLNDILEKVEADDDQHTIDSIDLYELIGALMYLSGYRRIGVDLLDPFAKNAKRVDLRAATFALTVNHWKLWRFISSKKGISIFQALTKRHYGKAETLFITLRARPLNFSKLFQKSIGSSEKPILPGVSEEANILVQEIAEKVHMYIKQGRYPAPASNNGKAHSEGFDHVTSPVRKVFISGFGWSGSSALSDLMKDCKGVMVMPGPGKHDIINLGAEDETTIFEDVGSLAILWDKFVLGMKKPNALLDFVRLHVLGVLPKRALEMKACLWTRSIVKKYDVNYYRLVDEFLYGLLGGQSNSIDEKKKSFIRFTNRLIHLVARDKDAKVILFDNAIKAQNIRRLEMIGDATCVVVARDPDDQYISMQNENMYMTRSPEAFVSMQHDKLRSFLEGVDCLEGSGCTTYAVFFEDLVQNNAQWRKKLLRELLGSDVEIPSENRPDAKFKASESIKNIGQYKNSGRRIASEYGLTKEIYEKILDPYLWRG